MAERNLTISEYLTSDPKFKNKIKNTSGEFKIGITRKMIVDEATALLDTQIEKGLISDEFKQEYLDIVTYQRSFSEGPESGPYANPLKKMIGTCAFDGQERASRCAPSSELFTLIQKLSNIRYYESNHYRDTSALTKEQIQVLVDKAIKDEKKITYKVVRDVIGSDVNFRGLTLAKNDYKEIAKETSKHKDKTIEEIKYNQKLKTEIYAMTSYKLIKSSLKKQGFIIDDMHLFDEIATLLSKYKSDDEIRGALDEFTLISQQTDDLKAAIVNLDESKFKEFGKLSLNIIYQLNELMLTKGIGYSDAMKEIGLDHANKKSNEEAFDKLPPIYDLFDMLDENVTNRSVIATLHETKKIINALISKYGKPYAIHVEVARELTKTDKEKQELIDRQLENKASNLETKMIILNKYPSVFDSINKIKHDDVIKYRLFVEQSGIDPYMLAFTADENKAKIAEKDLFSENYEVDHIIPYSISFDDTFTNKLLVNKKMNQEKGNRIPFEAFNNCNGFDKYCSYIISTIRSTKKRELIFATKITDDMKSDFSARALNDTRYATKTLCKILRYAFPDITIRSFTGQITSKLKGVWGLNNVTHSYQSLDYVLHDEYNADLDHSYVRLAELDTLTEDDAIRKEKKELKALIIKLERERDEKNRENHYHHAMDATVIACATDTLRRRVEMHEQYVRQKTANVQRYRTTKVNVSTGEVEYDVAQSITTDFAKYYELTKNMDPKHFPVPYDDFRTEAILRIYERNPEVLTQRLMLLSNYTSQDVQESKPLLISFKADKKNNARLHEATIYGVAPSGENESVKVLTQRKAIDSEKFDAKKIEKIYDKDGTQKAIYETTKEWLGGYSNGSVAFAERGGYPKQPNGNLIKKVKLDFDEPKEQILIHPDKQQYVDKTYVVEIHIYKKEDDDKLYFVGIDMYRKLNFTDDVSLILWCGRRKNKIQLKKRELASNGFTLYKKLYKNEIINLKLRNGVCGICRVVGFSSGMFEVDSISGDQFDIIHQKLSRKIKKQITVTVSTIKDVEVVHVNILGE